MTGTRNRAPSSTFYTGQKVINDPVHGHIKLDKYTIEFIDTVQFQRLRDLKQLGSAYFVFPGASHNRFEHSIGVSHLAGSLIERFEVTQPELEITPEDVKCVKLAGLCHDLGHGPYSHIFDNGFMQQVKPGLHWSHEEGSEMMLEYLIDDNHIDIEADQINMIKALISGTPRSTSQANEKRFLFDIVANKRNSVDVDKFDYIERDTLNLGIRNSYDAKRLLVYSRVVDNEICYDNKEVFNLYEMFHTRYNLFKQIYTHRVGKAIELMITDVLVHADQELGLSDAVTKPEEYLNLTDDILRVIERSKTPELAKSREIMKRLRTRNLYKFVDEFLLPSDLEDHINDKEITAKEIVSHQSDNDHITEDDVIVTWSRMNYAMKDRNPVDSIRFYSKFDNTRSFTIPKEQVSFMIPSTFQEVSIRIFTRDPHKSAAIQRAFRRLLKKYVPEKLLSESNPALTFPSDYEATLNAKHKHSGSQTDDHIVKKWRAS